MDYLIFFFIFFIFLILIICGLPYRNTYYKNQIADLQKEMIKENFKSSSKNDVEQGASTFYDWGLKKDNKTKQESCSNGKYLDDKKTIIKNDYYIYPSQKKQEPPQTCNNCEAYKCKNIDRYVLKSSVPPCPDMSQYALKSMVNTCPDMSNYILKSQIPLLTNTPDMSKYVLKSQIPVCPELPDLSKYVLKSQIPACPNPVVYPPPIINIEEDPRFKNWFNQYQVEMKKMIDNKYITKEECNKRVNQINKKIESEEETRKKIGPVKDTSKKMEEIKENRIRDQIRFRQNNIMQQKNKMLKKKLNEKNKIINKNKLLREKLNIIMEEEQYRKKQLEKNQEEEEQLEKKQFVKTQFHKEQSQKRQFQKQQYEEEEQYRNKQNRLADLDKKQEFQKNLGREKNLSKQKCQDTMINAENDDFVMGWDPTSLGFGSINYQMKAPIIK